MCKSVKSLVMDICSWNYFSAHPGQDKGMPVSLTAQRQCQRVSFLPEFSDILTLPFPALSPSQVCTVGVTEGFVWLI